MGDLLKYQISKKNLKEILKKSFILVFIVTKIKEIYKKHASQSNDSFILQKLLKWHPTIPKSFIEFGFHAWEFNCIELAKNKDR